MSHFTPANSMESPRFTGVRTFARLPNVTELTDVDLAVVGLPFDTGVTYRVGARFGPEAVRSASVMLRAYNPELKVKPFEVLSCVDYGDATVYPGFIHESYESMTRTVAYEFICLVTLERVKRTMRNYICIQPVSSPAKRL